jgi:hypothetical protein
LEGSGLEHVPITQEELSMISSVSPIDYYNFGITIKCTYLSTEQNNKMTENGSANATSFEVSMTSSNLNVVNHAPETEIGFEESGWPKHKRVLQQLAMADALNGCLCGLVLDSSLSGVIKCKQAGCETQWVSTCFMGTN